MNGPFNSVADVRKYVADLDAEKCPVARRTRELREERERRHEPAVFPFKEGRMLVLSPLSWACATPTASFLRTPSSRLRALQL